VSGHVKCSATRLSRPRMAARFLGAWAICFLCFPGLAQDGDLMPPSQSVAPAIVSAESGAKASGVGERWSPWYQLSVGKAPVGYTVKKSEFWLTGDRSCGTRAECHELKRSDEEVVWEFRLQGDDQGGIRKEVFSEGHMRVTYRPR